MAGVRQGEVGGVRGCEREIGRQGDRGWVE